MHIILEKANRYDLPSSDPRPEGAIYDKARGYWAMGGTEDPYIAVEGAPSLSKKCDRETGEDQKGE